MYVRRTFLKPNSVQQDYSSRLQQANLCTIYNLSFDLYQIIKHSI